MAKKFKDRAACAMYISLGWGVAMFLISFSLEGWNMSNIEHLFQSPIGIGGLLLGLAMVILFVWNFRRDEPTRYEWLQRRDARLPDLYQLKDALRDYFIKTNVLKRDDSLYDTRAYGFNGCPSITQFYELSNNNRKYLRLKMDKDREINVLHESIKLVVSRLLSGRLADLVDKAIQAEHPARSQLIAVRLYRTQYLHTKRNEGRLLDAEAERRIPNNVKQFGKCLRDLYTHIGVMIRGDDI